MTRAVSPILHALAIGGLLFGAAAAGANDWSGGADDGSVEIPTWAPGFNPNLAWMEFFQGMVPGGSLELPTGESSGTPVWTGGLDPYQRFGPRSYVVWIYGFDPVEFPRVTAVPFEEIAVDQHDLRRRRHEGVWVIGLDSHARRGLDFDGDGYFGCNDNCPGVANVDQSDTNGDGLGDACAELLWGNRDEFPELYPPDFDVFTYPNACEAARTLEGLPNIRMDAEQGLLHLPAIGIAPCECNPVYDPVDVFGPPPGSRIRGEFLFVNADSRSLFIGDFGTVEPDFDCLPVGKEEILFGSVTKLFEFCYGGVIFPREPPPLGPVSYYIGFRAAPEPNSTALGLVALLALAALRRRTRNQTRRRQHLSWDRRSGS